MSSKPSPLSRPLPDANLPRNNFPRGFTMNLNFSSGMLLPVFCQYVPLGTKFRLNRSIFMRSAEVNTAAFPVIDTDIDFYVVPLPLLMTRYDELKTNVQDVNSSAFGHVQVPSLLPYVKVSDLASVFADNAQNPPKDIFGDLMKPGVIRLLDLLGYDDDSLGVNSVNGLELNTLKLQAYQKVYYDHYRNTAYEKNDPFAYNADNAYLNNGVGRITDTDQIAKMCELHYVNYRKDYFQAVYPGLNYVAQQVSSDRSPWQLPTSIVGASQSFMGNIVATATPDHGRWRNGVTNTPLTAGSALQTYSTGTSVEDAAGELAIHSHGISGSVSFTQDSNTFTNVQAIRAAFAMDKLLRATSYAPQHVKDQLEARFGVKLRKSYGHESTFIGSFRNSMVIGEVTSTANTASGNAGDALGAIGGKGVSASQSGQTINYTVESDSIVIGVLHTTTRPMYDSHRIDNFNLKRSREDLPIPEFMDMGLRPLLRMELQNSATSAVNNYVIGYVTRDQEYKVGINENHGLFRDGNQLGIFAVHTNSVSRLGASPYGSILATAAYFKVSPSDLDSLFLTQYDYTSQLTDQFFGQISFVFDCRQNMSVHGQPRL